MAGPISVDGNTMKEMGWPENTANDTKAVIYVRIFCLSARMSQTGQTSSASLAISATCTQDAVV